MTDNEIIKALEICILGDCSGCDVRCESSGDCRDALNKKSLDLINRQQAEIETARIGVKSYKGKKESAVKTAKELQTLVAEQQTKIERLRENNKAIMQTMADVHTEAIKEFAERLMEKSINTYRYDYQNDISIHEKYVTEKDIDNLVKEMVGEDK